MWDESLVLGIGHRGVRAAEFGVESAPKSEAEIQNRGLKRKLPKKDFLGYKNRVSETIHKHS